MTFEILKNKKDWQYKKKTEKIAEYLKDKIKNYPATPMKYDLFLAECSFDLSYKKADFVAYVKILEQLGYVQIMDGNIVSVSAEQKLKSKIPANISDEVMEMME